jgi:hypothetical protein
MTKNINIELIKHSLPIAGETSGGFFSSGFCNLYSIISSDESWKLEIAHSFYDNGEEEIVAKNVFPERLNIIRNRLRLTVNKCELHEFNDSKFVTLRMARLKKEGTTEWANLRNASIGELSEVLGGNALKYFKLLGAITVDYKVDLFKQSGSSANQLVVIYPNENTAVPIQAFLATRLFPILT